MVDTFLDESDYEGFSFDWDDQDPDADDNLQPNLREPERVLTPEVAVDSDPEPQICTVCHKSSGKEIIYENDCTFCSLFCWKNALYTAADDLVIGGVSSWPLSTWVSYEAKSLLLNLATDSFDASMIIKLLRQFQVSLSPTLFERLILGNSVAFNHFTNFLRKSGQNALLHQYLMAKHSTEHAMIEPFKDIISMLDNITTTNARKVIDQLHEFVARDWSKNTELFLLKETCLQLAELLQYQLHHNTEWASYNQSLKQLTDGVNSLTSTNAPTQSDSADKSVLALPLGATIRAFVWMDKIVGPNSRAGHLKSRHKVCEDQFKWFVIHPLVDCGNFSELDSMLLEKKWLKRRIETTLPNDRLVLYLHSLKAPETVLVNYLLRYNDQDDMMELAVRLGVYRAAVSCCAKSKNQNAMKILLNQIPEVDPEHSRVLYYLSIPVNQWKEELMKN